MHATARIASVLFGAALTLGLLAGVTPAHGDGSHGDSGFSHHRAGSEVNTSDWPQGKSLSDPDGDDNLGMDKPGGEAGTVGDQDGNNGCGNDGDRDDDNNGNCGREEDQAAARVRACPDQDRIRHEDGADDESEAEDDDSDDKVKADDDSDADDDEKAKCAESDDTVTAAGTVATAATRVEAAAAVAPAPAAAAPGTTVAGAVETAGTDTTTPTTAGTQVLGITETRPDTLARTGAGLAGLVAAAGACLGGGRLFGLARRRFGS